VPSPKTPRPLSDFARLVSRHRDAWLNVLGNPLADGHGCRLAPPPAPPNVEPALTAARERIERDDLPADVRNSLGQRLCELEEAHQAFVAEAQLSHAAGVKEATHGIYVLNRPLPGRLPNRPAEADQPADVVERLSGALLDFEALANLAEFPPAHHDLPPEPPLAERAAKYRRMVVQARDALRGAASAGQLPPDGQAIVDRMLNRWERYLREETPPGRRLVTTAAEAADALNAILRELDGRESLRPKVATPAGAAQPAHIEQASPQAEGTRANGTVTPPEQTSPVARAIALMWDHHRRHNKLMPVTGLLKLITDTSKASLYRDPGFRAARAAIKKALRGNLPGGFLGKDGRVEAEDE
jgi:hypothetical protein